MEMGGSVLDADDEPVIGPDNVDEARIDDAVLRLLRLKMASVAQPVRRLRGFQRIGVQPGQEQVVTFSLSADDLGFWTNEPGGRFLVEPGDFLVTVSDGVQRQHLSLRLI